MCFVGLSDHSQYYSWQGKVSVSRMFVYDVDMRRYYIKVYNFLIMASYVVGSRSDNVGISRESPR